MNNDNKRSAGGLGLVGDIGGTNARFALWRGQRLESIEVLACADYPRPELAVRDYLARIGESVANIDSVCLACAGPVGAADFRFTNNHWVINRAAFREELGLDHLLLVNDFSTMAWAASRLGADELVQVRAGSAQADRARLIIGPGTGLGVGSLLPLGGDVGKCCPARAGTSTCRSLRRATSRSGRACRRATDMSPPSAHCPATACSPSMKSAVPLDGVAVRASSAAEVGALAMAGDAQADAVLEHFFLWLARVAGNAVLTVGALGGVYITGGIVPRFLERFIASGFAEAFASRGKTSGAYLQDVPVWVMTAEHPGLLGAGVALQQALDAEG